MGVNIHVVSLLDLWAADPDWWDSVRAVGDTAFALWLADYGVRLPDEDAPAPTYQLRDFAAARAAIPSFIADESGPRPTYAPQNAERLHDLIGRLERDPMLALQLSWNSAAHEDCEG
ncbi:MAG TPA: hypothetical protein VFJ16_31175 [Longimicrobium sp.]|nr:hypothetical protein [Longimicrobium sp.]